MPRFSRLILSLAIMVVVVVAVSGPAAAEEQKKTDKPNILSNIGRRHGSVQYQRLQPGNDGLQDAQY